MQKNLIVKCFENESIRKILLRMKLLAILFGAVSLVVSAKDYAQPDKLTLRFKEGHLSQVLDEIERSSNYIFIFSEKMLDVNRSVDINVSEEKIEKVLDKLFAGTENGYEISGRQILINKAEKLPELNRNESPERIYPAKDPADQQNRIAGSVKNSKGEPVIGATVVIKGTAVGTLTDINGEYVLPNIPVGATIQFSFIGMDPQEIVWSGSSRLDVIMKESVMELEEVVVVGYGVQKKATVTGSISAVQTKSLVQSPQANISNALVGRMTGLLSVTKEGQPGGDQATLRIRGTGTFSGSADPLVMVDGIESLNYNNIDPNEIENITILKDASATAVYGVRGANGVLLITTKRGAKGDPVLSFSSNYALTSFTDLRENLGSYEWAQAFNEALRYNSYFTNSYTPMFSEEDIEHYRAGDDPIFYPNTNWISLMMKPVSSQTQSNLNISGGSDMIKYFINTGYFNQQGLFNNTKSADDFDAQMTYQRYNFRSNFDFNITKRFTANVNISSQIETRTGPTQRVTYIIDRIYNAPPNNSPGIVDGKVINVYDVFGGNPLEQLLGTGLGRNFSNYLTSSVRLNHDLDFITKGLSVHGTISYWNLSANNKSYSKAVPTYKPIRLDDGSLIYAPQKEESPFGFSESNNKNRKTYFEAGLDYKRSFGSHNVSGLILYNQSKLFDPGLLYSIPNGYQGLVGRATYDYAGKYLAEFNMGFNGTENFAPGKRFGYFPAYSLGWVVSEEPFFPSGKIISYLKLRGSYGEVGNDKVGGNRFMYNSQAYTYQNNAYNFGEVGSTFQGYRGSSQGTLGNPLLTWERAKKTDLGLDMNFLKDKVKVLLDYFIEKRDDILANPGTTPSLVGITLPAQNWGRMKNSGYEAEINYNSNFGKVNYWAKATYTYAHNVILFQDEVPRPFTYQYRTGQSSGQMFGMIVDGFYNTWEDVNDASRPRSSWQNNRIMPGDFKYKDVNGDGVLNTDDQVPVGFPNFPEIFYGLSFGGDYKGFDLSILFQGADNVSRYTYITSVRPFENNQSCQAYIPELAWSPEKYASGAEIKLPHLSAQQVQVHDFQSSTFLVQDASYIRLKNAEIGYNFTANFLTRAHIKSMRIYANGYNLITWHGLYPGDDPEQVSQGGDWGPYPNTRTINFGINMKF